MQTVGANKSGSLATYITMALLIAAAGSIFNPVLSYYLSMELHLDPLRIAAFFVLLPIATIIIVQTVARFSDMGLQRPAIICLASCFGILSSLILFWRPPYWVLCTLGLILLGSYPVAFPQIFASAREYALIHLKGSIMFTTFLRSLASLSWVIGPPLSFGIVVGWGFDTLFIFTSSLFALYGLTCFFFLPNVLDQHTSKQATHVKWWTNRSVMLLCVSCACLFTAFSSYLTTMPLYLTQELKLDDSFPGYIFGLAAFIEIPLMFIAAKLSRRLGLKNVVFIGATSIVIFLCLFPQMQSKTSLLLVQFFSAFFIAFVSSMGMVLFQELLPSIPGQATSLYINSSTAGQIAGGAMISLAESGSYTLIHHVGMGIALVGVIFLWFVKKPPMTEVHEVTSTNNQAQVPTANSAADTAAGTTTATATGTATSSTTPTSSADTDRSAADAANTTDSTTANSAATDHAAATANSSTDTDRSAADNNAYNTSTADAANTAAHTLASNSTAANTTSLANAAHVEAPAAASSRR